MTFRSSVFQLFPKKAFIVLGVSFLLFMGSMGGWIISTYEKNKKLTPLYEEIKNRESLLSSIKDFRHFKEKIAPFSLTAIKHSDSYASSWSIEKIKLASFLEATARQFFISNLAYQIGPPSSHAFQIPIEIHASIQNPLSLFHFMSTLYKGPYFLYSTHLSLHTKETSLFEAVINLEWFFPEQSNTKALYDFLVGLDISPLEYPSAFEEDLSSLTSFFEKEESSPFKENLGSSPTLTGIFYINPQKWTVWIDDVPITPTDNPTPYTIFSVTPHTVHLETLKGPLFLSL